MADQWVGLMARQALEQTIRRIARRRAMTRTLRQVSVASLIFMMGLYAGFWPPTVAWTLLLLCLGSLHVEAGQHTAKHVDMTGQFDGQIECAMDHCAEEESPVVVAQRARALKALAGQPIARHAPWPHPLWWVPVVGLLVTVGFTERVPTPATPTIDSAPAFSAVDKRAAVVQPGSTLAKAKAKVAKTRMNVGGSAEEERATNTASTAVVAAGKGRQTGKVGGGASEGRMIPLDGTGRARIRNTKRQGAMSPLDAPSSDAIAEPARPFPKKYHAVIESWFLRKEK